MSLQLAAQHLASKGRGPDTTLVHMTPGEVQSLQTLARAHGGSLTVNPQTGLPEAGFLESILPLVAGAALGPAGFGLTATQAALATGAVGALATGSLKKGLMAGLGAYGGAGLMGSVAGAGEAALQAANSVPATGVPAVAGAAPVAPVAPAMASKLAGTAGTNAITGGTPGFGAVGGETFFSQPTQVTPMSQLMQTATPTPDSVMARPGLPEVVDRSSYSLMDKLKAGAGEFGKEPSKFLSKENMRYGLAALAPFAMQEQAPVAYKGSGPNPYQYRFNPGRVSNPTPMGGVGEMSYFNPSYQQYAEGGPVGDMSERNDQEMLLANGGQRFADGGSTNPYNYVYDPITKTYRDVSAAPTLASGARAPIRPVQDPNAQGYSSNSYDPENQFNAWGNLTPLEQAQFYSMHPTMAAITQTGQNLFGLTTLGQLQKAMVPEFVQQQKDIANGNLLANYMAQYDPFGNLLQPNQGMVQVAPLNMRGEEPAYGGTPTTGYDPGGFGAYGENVAPTASLGNDVDGFGSYVEQEGTPGEPSSGVVVGGPIGSSYGGVDVSAIGGYGALGQTAPGGAGFGMDLGFGEGFDSPAAAQEAADAAAAAAVNESSFGSYGENVAPSGAPAPGAPDGGYGSHGENVAPSGDGGGGGDGGGSGCFLTTAAVKHMGQKDDGEVLSTLRHFRDTYMRKNREKSKDVAWYYKNAPKIVSVLDEHPNADRLYRNMYKKYIKPAYEAIKDGDNEEAYRIYKQGIDYAKRVSNIEADELSPRYGKNGMAAGGITALAAGGGYNLGDYSDGGRLLRGPGDGVSDSIPASIGNKRPARLADGEFVVPARIVSELGNGSTEAGARKLYAMMDRIQKNRSKTVGKGKVAVNSRSEKHLPA